MVLTGEFTDNPRKLKKINLDGEFCGWISTFIPGKYFRGSFEGKYIWNIQIVFKSKL